MQQPVLITTTTPTLEEGKSIARLLVQKKLAGCVNILGPAISIYEWKGQVEEETEYKLFIKSKKENWANLVEAIEKIHSYSTPEISMLPIDNMYDPYRRWLADVIDI